ncbi:MAG TPA: hypothetical protein PLW48_10150 [Alphaproteobacteria bacterium]|nr:hypothetical protein [Rhodospirillaceae bacterium]HRJ67487.1 hypothetical protein [Alphaproteobacteria bacterium]
MNVLGKNIGTGFLPNVPTDLNELLGSSTMKGGFDALKNTEAGKYLATAAERPGDTLKRSYARLFNGHGSPQDAEAVLQDLLDQSLRRGMFMTLQGSTPEQAMPYFLERHGQNGFMIYLAMMIQSGRDLPPPGEKKSRSKKNK